MFKKNLIRKNGQKSQKYWFVTIQGSLQSAKKANRMQSIGENPVSNGRVDLAIGGIFGRKNLCQGNIKIKLNDMNVKIEEPGTGLGNHGTERGLGTCSNYREQIDL